MAHFKKYNYAELKRPTFQFRGVVDHSTPIN